MPEEKGSSHLGVGMLVGAIIGAASGLFVQSKKGKDLREDLVERATKLQTKLMKELKDQDILTKDNYNKVIDKVMDYFEDSKEIAKKDLPIVRAFLSKKWTSIEAQYKKMAKK